MILALSCLSGALLIALIVVAVIAFRARADVDLLHDRLSRYEEGIDLPHRKGDSSQSLAYGRLSMSDPDDTRRRSLNESGIKPLPGQAARRLSGAPMGSGTPPGNRRVTFGSEGHRSISSTDRSSLLPSIADHEDVPLFPEVQPLMRRTKESSGVLSPPTQAIPPPPFQAASPPQAGFVSHASGPRPNPVHRGSSLTDPAGATSPSQQVRRLPTAPKSSSGGHDSYTDPFAGSSWSSHRPQ
jgi:hypothetical protein